MRYMAFLLTPPLPPNLLSSFSKIKIFFPKRRDFSTKSKYSIGQACHLDILMKTQGEKN